MQRRTLGNENLSVWALGHRRNLEETLRAFEVELKPSDLEQIEDQRAWPPEIDITKLEWGPSMGDIQIAPGL